MYLEKLQVQGIRNICELHITLSPGINLFYGQNGSGKTSVLESVHLLSRGRSFRTRNLRKVIQFGQSACTCFGLINSGPPSFTKTPVGVMRDDGGKFVFKVSGSQVTTASQLAEVLTIQVINPDSFQLLEGSPGVRRSFIDWGVFHVEHSYREIWARFQKCLKHRNSLLRHGKIDRLQLSVWDREFCRLATQINSLRQSYLDSLVKILSTTLGPLGLEGNFAFSYLPGWEQDKALELQLDSAYPRDSKAGYTHFGPHRADLKIVIEEKAAADVLSRGQIKTLVFGLKLAQGRLFRERTGQNCIFLLDDLPSELDSRHRLAVSKLLSDMGVQVLVTGVERSDLESLWPPEIDKPALFHVEQGRIVKV